MPNVNNPHGLEPTHRNLVGGVVRARPYTKLSGQSLAIFRNDVVLQASDGGIAAGAAGTPGTDLWLGVALNGGAASTQSDHQIIDDPEALFDAQDDGTNSGFSAFTDRNLNVNFVFTAGDTVRNLSKHQLATSTKATTNTLDAKMRELIPDPNNAYGVNARVLVSINKHAHSKAAAGV